MSQPNCKERIGAELRGTMKDLRKLWKTNCEDPEKYDEDLGNFNEYGLAFDYVPPGTFGKQKRGYFRYQLSWGGPSDEFRFFTNPDFSVYRIEYWFMDWFDGAKKILKGRDYDLLAEIFEDFRDCGTVEHVYREAMED